MKRINNGKVSIMKSTIILRGQEYDNSKTIQEQYGIRDMTLTRWSKLGVLPRPVRVGRFVYYNRMTVEEYLLGVNSD